MNFNTIFITGATSGIGEALAKRLAAHGKKLIITGRNEAKLKELKSSLPGEIIPIVCAIEDDYKPLLNVIKNEAPDLIINNAGYGLYGNAIDHDLKQETSMVRVNCEAVLAFTLQGAKTLRERSKQGTILNVSSAGGFNPFPTFATYVASKAFVTSVSTSLDEEMQDWGIRVLAACPGVIKTDFSRRASPSKKNNRRPFTMTVDYAVDRIIKQIETGKRVEIFDWHYKLLIFVSKFIPKSILCKMLKNQLKKDL